MKNVIEFYYNISSLELYKTKDNYSFNLNGNNFLFIPFLGDENKINDLYELNLYLINYIKLDSIILNRYNSPITSFNGVNYILTTNNYNKKVSLRSISNMANINIMGGKTLERNNWELLWENKVDYFEMQILENEKKYPLVRESFDYYIGMAENAISYLVNTKLEVTPTDVDRKVVSHINLNNSIYNPINIILDHKARDLSEYIKLAFFLDNKNIFNELDSYFHYNIYSEYGIRVLIARLLYPSFYFDAYDKIISGSDSENILNIVINRTSDYEVYLYNIYIYLRRFYDIPFPDWLKKRGINPHLQL